MRPIKKSHSGLQLIQRINFSNLNSYGNGIAFNKNQEKVNRLEYDIEKQRETIVKLQYELNEKGKEFNTISTKNRKKKFKFQKTIKLIEELLKICDNKKDENESKNQNNKELKQKTEVNSPLHREKSEETFKSINNDNRTNLKTFYTTNNSYHNKKENENPLPKIIKSPRNKLTIKTNYNFNFICKKKLKDMLYENTLRNKIDTLNDRIEKKNDEIIKLKDNNNIFNYSKLQLDFISNCDKLHKIKNENILILSKLLDIEDNYFAQKEENNKLRKKIEDFEEQFNEYRNNITKKNMDLQNKLKIFEEKNVDCILYHCNKGNNIIRNKSFFDENKSKLTIAENLIEKKMKELNETKKDIDNKNMNINYYKREINKLIDEKKIISDKNTEINNNIGILNKKRQELIKKNLELQNKKKDLKIQFDKNENEYYNEINKINEIKDVIGKKDKEINKLKKEIEEIKKSKIKNFNINI